MTRLVLVALLAICLLNTGCLVGGHSAVKREGTYVSASTVEQIEPGKTSKAWVRAVIGDPSERVHVDDAHEIWKYPYTETKDSSGYVFLIFETSDQKVTHGTFFVEFADDVVTKTWRG